MRHDGTAARALYSLLLYALVPVVLARLALRGLRNHDYWHRWNERFGFITPVSAARVIWVHAVSVGEVRAALPLVQALRERYPAHHVFVTTMTPTGSQQVRALFGGQVGHCYVPYDLPSAVRRFLDRVRPELALIMETELWPNIFHQCRARGIPLMLANVRMSERSMQAYLRFGKFTSATLRHATLLAAQNRTDAERMIRLGAVPEAVHVTGSIKFEISLPASLHEVAEALRGQWGRRRSVWVAASTHEGEDELVLEAFRSLRQSHPRLLLVLVPRHPERFALAARLCRGAGFNVALRSERKAGLAADTDILVGDTMGELLLFYAAADVAFVGGSLVATGGHNLLEAAAVGVPVVFGPHMFNFAEISRMTLARRAGRQVRDAAGLAAAVGDYLESAEARFAASEAGKKMVEENRGALTTTLRLIERLIAPPLAPLAEAPA